MAKTYAQRNADSVAKYGKTLYERRKETGLAKGKTLKEVRGHGKDTGRASRGTQGTQGARGTRGQGKAPTGPRRARADRRGEQIGQGGARFSSRSPKYIFDQLKGREKTPKGTLTRVYFRVLDKNTGQWVNVYKGDRGKAHGITIKELKNRIRESGADSIGEAFRDVLSGDSAEGSYDDDEIAPEDFDLIEVYILPY